MTEKLNTLFGDNWSIIHGVVVTTGTGEGAFAYDLADVRVWSDDRTIDHTDYQTWCNEVEALVDLDLALAIWAAIGTMIDVPGACRPIVNITAAHDAGLRDAEDGYYCYGSEDDLNPTEGLVSALGDDDLADHLGLDPEELRDADKDWTPATLAALHQYRDAYRAEFYRA